MSKGYTARKHAQLIARDGREADVCPWCEREFSKIEPRLVLRRGRLFEVVATLEHCIAKRDGGSMDPSNLVRACIGCNERRERLSAIGVQDELTFIDRLIEEERRRQTVREERRALAFERSATGWARAQ